MPVDSSGGSHIWIFYDTLYFAKRALIAQHVQSKTEAQLIGEVSFQAVLLLSKCDKKTEWIPLKIHESILARKKIYTEFHLHVYNTTKIICQCRHLQWPFGNSKTTTCAGTCPLWRPAKALQRRSIAMVAGRSEGEWTTGAARKTNSAEVFLAGLLHPGRLTWNMSSWRFGSDHFPLINGWLVGSLVNLPWCTVRFRKHIATEFFASITSTGNRSKSWRLQIAFQWKTAQLIDFKFKVHLDIPCFVCFGEWRFY